MNDLDELRRHADPERIVRVLAQVAEVLAQYDRRLDAIQGRLLIVDELPANAPLGALIRLRGDLTGALYLGNGPTRPLTKLLPVAL